MSVFTREASELEDSLDWEAPGVQSAIMRALGDAGGGATEN